MSRRELIALAERVKSLTGPCAGDEADIELAIGNWSPEHHEAWNCYQEVGECANPPFTSPCPPRRFTASLDAAMSLAGDDFGSLMRGKFPDGSTGFVCVVKGCEAAAKTAPNAVTAAALRALAEQEQ